MEQDNLKSEQQRALIDDEQRAVSSQTNSIPSNARKGRPPADSIDSFLTGPNHSSKLKSSRFWRMGIKMDIFGFEPVPTTTVMSTTRSQIGSVVLFSLFFLFVLYSLYEFFFNSAPRLNTYSLPIDLDQEFEQEFAFGFYLMDDSSNLIDDPTMFTYYLEQYNFSNVAGSEGHEDLSKPVAYQTCRPSWAPVQIDMLCPTKPMVMMGQMNKGTTLKYPRVKLLKCNEAQQPGVKCNEQGAIMLFPRGRLFVFIKSNQQTNFATGAVVPESGVFYYYFIVPGLYDRAQITIQTKQVTKYPNYASSFQKDVQQTQYVSNNYFFVSNVTSFFPASGGGGGGGDQVKVKGRQNVVGEVVDPSAIEPFFAWWMVIDSTQVNVDVVFENAFDLLSVFGGFWGVLVGGFSFFYLAYNMKMFYKQNKPWDKFDKVIHVNQLETIDLNLFDEKDEEDSHKNNNKPVSSHEHLHHSGNIEKAAHQEEEEHINMRQRSINSDNNEDDQHEEEHKESA